ncbi:hypothetical protein QOZ80_6AG0544350 [Eleusine coracana subsp. coracana]|nr:hypothetical protein QOZ80_6AG0544350 [Eleusine coracana subsp. coracana]
MASVATQTAAPVPSGEEVKEFMVEMRARAMRLHSKDQSWEGMAEALEPPVATWNPTVEGYISYLVDMKLVFGTLEAVVNRAAIPWYAELQNNGLERSEALKKDLEWFSQQGYTIPQPAAPGIAYSSFLEEVSEKDPQAFTCHFYNAYFGLAGGGRIIGRKVAEKILSNKEMDLYKLDNKVLQEVRGKLNKVTSAWSREEKDNCLAEIEKSFVYSRSLRRCLI